MVSTEALKQLASVPNCSSQTSLIEDAFDIDGDSDEIAEKAAADSDDEGDEIMTVPGCALRSLTRVDLRHIPGLMSTNAGVRALRSALCSFAEIVLTEAR